jgi:pimeloyl-ACP methyl ester carboxylesterase
MSVSAILIMTRINTDYATPVRLAMHSPRFRRRALLLAFLTAVSIVSFQTAVALAQTGTPARVQLTIPAPTGRYDVGTVSLHLVDQGRQDPFWSTSHPRELMVSLWYPLRAVAFFGLAPWMSPAILARFRPELESFLSEDPGVICAPGQNCGGGTFCPPGQTCPSASPAGSAPTVSLANVDFPITQARQGAPVERSSQRYPVVIYSPGHAYDREYGTMLAIDLASHGYVVATISHTYEAAEVEFPDQRVELARAEDPNNIHTNIALSIRRADVQFVIDELTALEGGANPDAEHRLLPAGLRGALDLAKIGIYGHSLGGATAADAMANDARIVAGINLDGSFHTEAIDPGAMPPPGSPPEEIAAFIAALNAELSLLGHRIHQPLMIMADSGCHPVPPAGAPASNPDPGCGPDDFGDLTSVVWHNLGGYKRFVSVVGTTHGSYTDDEWLINELAEAGIVPSAAGWVGTIQQDRAVAIERAYIRSFFDLWLKNTDDDLLSGPSAQYPEVKFY